MMRRDLKAVSFRQGAVKEVIEEVKGKLPCINLGNVAFGIRFGFTSPDKKE
jgi:hypothetical protein